MAEAVPSPKVVVKAELPQNGARACLSAMPYRTIVFMRSNGKVPLFAVAGKDGGPWGAEKALRIAFETHGGSCFYCQKTLAATDMSIDHVEPQKINGSDTLQNLVLACKPCNIAKAHKPIEAFNPNAGKAWLQALLKQVEDRLKRLD